MLILQPRTHSRWRPANKTCHQIPFQPRKNGSGWEDHAQRSCLVWLLPHDHINVCHSNLRRQYMRHQLCWGSALGESPAAGQGWCTRSTPANASQQDFCRVLLGKAAGPNARVRACFSPILELREWCAHSWGSRLGWRLQQHPGQSQACRPHPPVAPQLHRPPPPSHPVETQRWK